jgi:uncharacterized membrane protein
VSLAPLLDAAPIIQVHAFSAIAAFALGIVQLAAPKGTLPHRTLGWIWVALMFVVAFSSFWIHGFNWIGSFSPIHLLSIFTLAVLPLAVLHAHRHRVNRHDRPVHRRARHRRPFHLLAGPHHARSRVRELSRPRTRRILTLSL